MTKNRSMRLAVLILALALITCCFVGTTFAKYTSTASGSSTATVAKWDIKANGTDITAEDAEITFNLFDTIYEVNGTDEDEDVASGKIAPGTSGKFNFTVANDSEVNAKYYLTFDTPDLGIENLTYTFKVGEDTVTEDAIEIGMGDTHTVEVTWLWPFEAGDDLADTDAGIKAATGDVTVTLVVEQVD